MVADQADALVELEEALAPAALLLPLAAVAFLSSSTQQHLPGNQGTRGKDGGQSSPPFRAFLVPTCETHSPPHTRPH